MRTYMIPSTCDHGVELPPTPALRPRDPLTPSDFQTAMDNRVSHRFFTAERLGDETVQRSVLEPLAYTQAATPGLRFVCAVRSTDHTGTVAHLTDEATLVDAVTPNDWVDLYLQEEFVTAPVVVVAVVELTDDWRNFEHRIVTSTAALSNVWFDARRLEPPLEGSIFAGILAGWLRSVGMIRNDETTGVALGLGIPQAPLT